jgi:tetratricopeptide (TPR) repeat protein
MRAIEKDRTRRYESAGALYQDIERYLADEPVLAGPPSAAYKLRKFARRNKMLVGGAITAFIVLAAGLVITTILLGQVSAQRNEAVLSQQRMREVARFQSTLFRDIDIRRMGEGIVDAIRLEIADDDQPVAINLEDALDRANPSNLARAALSDFIVRRATATLDGGYTDDPMVEAELRQSVADMYMMLFLYDEGVIQYERARELYLAELGEDDPRTLTAMQQSAYALHQLDRSEEAEVLYRQAADGMAEAFGPDDRASLRARADLASVLPRLGRTEEAERILIDVIERQQALPGSGADDVIYSKNTLSAVYSQTNRLDLAVKTQREAFDAQSQRFGEWSPGTLVIRQNYALYLKRAGRLEEAAAHLQEVVSAWVASAGDDHEATVVNRVALASVLREIGRPEEAETMLRAAAASAVRIYPPGNRHRVSAESELADLILQLETERN